MTPSLNECHWSFIFALREHVMIFYWLDCQNLFRICSAWISVLKGYSDLKMRAHLQYTKKASSEGCALMHDSPNRRVLYGHGRYSWIQQGTNHEPNLESRSFQDPPHFEWAARRAAQHDCKSWLSAPLEILAISSGLPSSLCSQMREGCQRRIFLKSDEARLYKLSECVHFGASTADDSVAITVANFTKLMFKISRKVRKKTQGIYRRRNMCCDQHCILSPFLS